mmetsp:Transcript_11617/g.24439  ORF Transcript_11617/g.24439 Transcript_11617/m.24439 type:complete len:799 (+) Transcript_11617:253-2649(+)
MAPFKLGKLSSLPLLCLSALAQQRRPSLQTNYGQGTSRDLRKDVVDRLRDGSSNDIKKIPSDGILNVDQSDQIMSSSLSTTTTATITTTKTSASRTPPLDPAAAVFQASNCDADEVLWSLVLVTDDYAYETSWELKNDDGQILAFGPPNGTNYDRENRYVGNMCLSPGEYMLTIKDKMGDGNCCEFGQGSFSVAINGVVLIESDGSPFSVKELPFLIQPESSPSPSLSPLTSSPSPSSRRPTELTILTPTSYFPTSAPTRAQPSSNRTGAPTSSPTANPTIPTSEIPTEEKSSPPPNTLPPSASERPTVMLSSTFTESPSMAAAPTVSTIVASNTSLTTAPSTTVSVSSSVSPSTSSSVSPTILSPAIPAVVVSEPPTLASSKSQSFVPTFSSTEYSSVSPSTNLSAPPVVSSSAPLTAVPSTSFTPTSLIFDFSDIFPATQERTPSPSTNPSTTRVAVAMSPFILYMTMRAESEDPNIDELDDIVSEHLLRQMQAKPSTSQATKVSINLKKISSIGRRLQTLDGTETEDFDISVDGDVYFVGDDIPTTEEIDEVNQASFDAEKGTQFIDGLQKAEDPSLRSIESISVPFVPSKSEDLQEDYLRNEEEPSQTSANNALYILIVVFFVGILLVAVFVHRTRVERRSLQGGFPEVERNEKSYDSGSVPSLPTYIDVMPTRTDQFSTSHKKIHVVGERKEGESVGYGNYCDTMTEIESQILPHIDSEESNRDINPSHFSEAMIPTIKEDQLDDTGFLCGIGNNDDEACVTAERKIVVQNDWGVNPTASEDTESMYNRPIRS